MMKKIKKKSMKKDLLMTSLKLFHLGITIAGFVVFWLFFYSPQFMNQNVDYLVYTVSPHSMIWFTSFVSIASISRFHHLSGIVDGVKASVS